MIGETAEVGDDCTIDQGITLGGTAASATPRCIRRGRRRRRQGSGSVRRRRERAGSNAVVVREVRPGATAIGIPARIISEEAAQRREQNAARIGFSAYAVTRDADDPLSFALHGLIDHTVELTLKVEAMAAALDALGAVPTRAATKRRSTRSA